jgi:hypothetical protein
VNRQSAIRVTRGIAFDQHGDEAIKGYDARQEK